MIDFSLTDEQRALREMAHDFAAKEIRPVAWEFDRDATWPEAIIEKAWEVGLMNAHIPEEYGGAGASFIDGVLIEEELGWGCSGIGTSISCNGLASAPVLLGGSEQVKKTYLGMLTEAAEAGVVLPDRARCGLRRVGHAHDAPSAGRQVRHQRFEDVHHQRRLRGLVHGLRQDRPRGRPPRHLGVRGPSRRRRRRWTSTRTRWASARRIPRPSRSTTSRFRRRTCSARRTTASGSR